MSEGLIWLTEVYKWTHERPVESAAAPMIVCQLLEQNCSCSDHIIFCSSYTRLITDADPPNMGVHLI